MGWPDQVADTPALHLPFILIRYPGFHVTRIVDGDTINVQIGEQTHRLRYIGIETPEQGEAYCDEATEANRQLVEGKNVVLERDVSEVDRYGRLLRYVYLEDGTFVNAELVRLGWVRATPYPPDVRYQDLFAALEREARAAGRGIWAGATPTPAPGGVAIRFLFYDGWGRVSSAPSMLRS
jgi:micrococcal nuclease